MTTLDTLLARPDHKHLIWEAVFGSEFEITGWWQQCTYYWQDETKGATLEIDDPDADEPDIEPPLTFTLTADDVVAAFTKWVNGFFSTGAEEAPAIAEVRMRAIYVWGNDEIDIDLDAFDADAILQIAIFNDYIYG